MRFRQLIPGLLLAGWRCPPSDAAKTKVNILFVGNSLTFVNSLPSKLTALCRSASSEVEIVNVQSSTAGGGALIEHAVDPSRYNEQGFDANIKSIGKIRQNNAEWDYVVLQEQSGNYFSLEPPVLNNYGRLLYNGQWASYPHILVDETRRAGAQPIFFQNWPGKSAPPSADTGVPVFRPYNYITHLEQAMCAPFGMGLLKNWGTTIDGYNGGNPLEGKTFTDNIHPSAITQYTNAAILYAMMTGKSPVNLENNGGLAANVAKVLRQNAWDTYTEYKAEVAASPVYSVCNTIEGCIRFKDENGDLKAVPTPTTTAMTTTTKLLNLHAPCDPRADLCNGAKDLVCLESDYQCRYKTTATIATSSTAALNLVDPASATFDPAAIATTTATTSFAPAVTTSSALTENENLSDANGSAGNGAVVGGVVGGLLFLLVLVASVIAVRKSKSNANGRRARGNVNRTVAVASINNPGFVGTGVPNAAKHGSQQRTKVRITNPQSPYSDEIYADIEEEIYVCAGGEIQALTAQASSAGVRNPSSMAGSLDDSLAKVIDGVVSMLAGVGQPTNRAAVERRLKATLPREASGGGERGKELEDAQRAIVELQRKIADLQATRTLPSVPGDQNASAERGGGMAHATYTSSSSGTAVPAAPIYATYAPQPRGTGGDSRRDSASRCTKCNAKITFCMCNVRRGTMDMPTSARPSNKGKKSAVARAPIPSSPYYDADPVPTDRRMVPEPASQNADGGVADDDYEWPETTTATCARGITSGGRACSHLANSSGQLYCHNHACPHVGCGKSKSSADLACAKHLPQGMRPRAPTNAGTTTATATVLVPELVHQDANGGVADDDYGWPVNT